MKTLCMKTVFDVLITIRATSIMHIFFFVTEKTAKIITNKEDAGLQSMYNRQNVPKNIPVLSFYQRGGSRNLSKMSLQTLMKKNLTGSENLVLANMVCSFQSSNHYSSLLMNMKYRTKFTDQE